MKLNLRVYRIAGHEYAFDLSGTGAAINGGRWNKKGTLVLYTGESREIALLETIVHFIHMLVPALDLLIFEIPEDSISELRIDQLPSNWLKYPAPVILAEMADLWVHESKTLAFKVLSCIVKSAHN